MLHTNKNFLYIYSFSYAVNIVVSKFVVTKDAIKLDVSVSDTIESIKEQIQEKEKYPVSRQVIMCSKETLENSHSLFFYNIQKDSKLHLIIKFKGETVSFFTECCVRSCFCIVYMQSHWH